MAEDDLDKMDRFSKLANVLWPGFASDEVREMMDERLRNEGKRLRPIDRSQSQRQGHSAKEAGR